MGLGSIRCVSAYAQIVQGGMQSRLDVRVRENAGALLRIRENQGARRAGNENSGIAAHPPILRAGSSLDSMTRRVTLSQDGLRVTCVFSLSGHARPSGGHPSGAVSVTLF